MLKFTKSYGWAGGLACLAIGVAASGAFADDEQHKSDGQKHEVHRQSTDDDSQSSDRDRQRAEQEKQRSQQDQQRAEQNKQRSQQDRQRADRQRQGESRGFPQPNRESYSRDQQQWNRERDEYSRDQQWNRDQQYGRDSQRSAQSGDDGGLGVSIARGSRDGITVVRVHRDSPAEQMGIQEGDRITHLNGRKIESTQQFISQIRNMDPGEEIELDVRRDSQERTFRGELESRQEALVLRGGRMQHQSTWDERRGTRQTGYEEGRGIANTQQRRSGDVERQLSQIERQLDQLSQTVEDLRYAVRDIRQQSSRGSRETTARYEEYREGTRTDGARTSGRWQDENRQFDGSREMQRSREMGSERGFDSNRSQQSGQYDQGSSRSRQYQYEEGESIGGETGESRLRPDRN